ncbi:hypothetical protein [Prosthecomicrobium hirschii]|uniref:hypothetical protein n=1 Tax=Prosthecodimorpha hirschii TaxID=665126 RepID=UPI00128F8BA5|nr:hypothetical protein [Prosthecomicrobium hirschii]
MSDAWILWDVKSLPGGDLELDYNSYNQEALGSILGSEIIAVEDVGVPVYRTRSHSSALKGRHVLPTFSGIVVDNKIKDAIEEQGLSAKDVQFCPVKIECRFDTVGGYYILLIHRTVNCVNLESKGILSYSRYGGFIRINDATYFEYFPGCLQDALIARDACQPSQAIFATPMKDKIASIDRNIDFRLPKDICAPGWACP